jgi:hypothetical protein
MRLPRSLSPAFGGFQRCSQRQAVQYLYQVVSYYFKKIGMTGEKLNGNIRWNGLTGAQRHIRVCLTK